MRRDTSQLFGLTAWTRYVVLYLVELVQVDAELELLLGRLFIVVRLMYGRGEALVLHLVRRCWLGVRVADFQLRRWS